jgi:hypothetical protein
MGPSFPSPPHPRDLSKKKKIRIAALLSKVGEEAVPSL